MSRNALHDVTRALQKLLHTALDVDGQPDEKVYLGPPTSQVGERLVSLFPFHLEPNRELRNARRFTARSAGGGPADPAEQDALPVDLRYLISVFRRPADASEPSELQNLGKIIAGLQENPTLGGALLPGQEVRLTPEPYSMEELSRIWGLFPNAAYVTSMVYLASPIFIEAREMVRAEPVEQRRFDSGSSAEQPDVFRDRSDRYS